MTRTGNKTGNKLSETAAHSEARNPLNPGPINRATPHPVGWGPGGRRFKSCLPDYEKCLEMSMLGIFDAYWPLCRLATGPKLSEAQSSRAHGPTGIGVAASRSRQRYWQAPARSSRCVADALRPATGAVVRLNGPRNPYRRRQPCSALAPKTPHSCILWML